MTGVADVLQDVVDAYKKARRQRDEMIVATVPVLGQHGVAEASGLSRRRVRRLLAAAEAADRQGDHR
jgi:DNA-binding transcriptional regulator LsrR (DeoR family)